MYGTIYKITNEVNGKVYIGQTKRSVAERFNAHCREVRHGMAITKAIINYGRENFKVEELASAFSQSDLNFLETYFIQKENSLSPNGYNLCLGGDGKSTISEETRQKLRDSHLGISNKGFKQTEQTTLNNSYSRGGFAIIGINLKTMETIEFPYVSKVKDFGFNRRDVTSVLRGQRKQTKGFFFMKKEDFIKQANQSGSTEINTSGHAQRIETETASAEYNVSTSLSVPTNYRGKATTEELLESYKELKSYSKVASKYGLTRTAVINRFKRNNIKV